MSSKQIKYLLSGTDRQTLRVALDEVKVLPAPVEHLEVGVELVQQRFARTVEVVRHVQRAGCEGTKHLKRNGHHIRSLEAPRLKYHAGHLHCAPYLL